MKHFVLYTLLLAAIGATAVAGVVHGRLSGRWGPPAQSVAFGQQLQQFPTAFGNWRSRESSELGRDVINLLQCTGYVNRRYVNQQTGESLAVAALVGPSGPISVHTPEVCYSSRDYQTVQPPKRVTIRDADGKEHEFWAMVFQATSVDQPMLSVYYGWSTGDRWGAPDSPRFAFVGKPLLFKVQLAAQLPAGADLKTSDPCRGFLQQFIPAFERHLFGAAKSPNPSRSEQ